MGFVHREAHCELPGRNSNATHSGEAVGRAARGGNGIREAERHIANAAFVTSPSALPRGRPAEQNSFFLHYGFQKRARRAWPDQLVLLCSACCPPRPPRSDYHLLSAPILPFAFYRSIKCGTP